MADVPVYAGGTHHAQEMHQPAAAVDSTALAIDHIAHTPDLLPVGDMGIWSERSAHGRYLSDHFGVWCDFG